LAIKYKLHLYRGFALSANGCSRFELSANGWLNQVENGCDRSMKESVFQIGLWQKDALLSGKGLA